MLMDDVMSSGFGLPSPAGPARSGWESSRSHSTCYWCGTRGFPLGHSTIGWFGGDGRAAAGNRTERGIKEDERCLAGCPSLTADSTVSSFALHTTYLDILTSVAQAR